MIASCLHAFSSSDQADKVHRRSRTWGQILSLIRISACERECSPVEEEINIREHAEIIMWNLFGKCFSLSIKESKMRCSWEDIIMVILAVSEEVNRKNLDILGGNFVACCSKWLA